ncbi:hypothetical protein LTR05_007488 [Lithohypha guttulata]|uniref:3-hydroxyacyl-CoA dehydrogenase n=1 Tax=Lithohypha guttulata TaxID=1690604 RepID=A0AAN7SVM3_9EURO|nr:hypothetical protein LTR05_007488 [Lithohypha guttulata]
MATGRRLAVSLLGAGTQGRRLAYMWSSCGCDVHLIDSQEKQLKDSLGYIEQLRSLHEPPAKSSGRIRTHTSDALKDALNDSWLVVECIPEKLPLKRDIIRQLDQVAPADTIIASNSSSYTIGEIIAGLDLTDSSRVLSTHSYWPPETSAIEIMGHKDTDPEHISTLMKQCADHGFKPFHVKRESTGYIYNRIWAAIKREALLTAAEEVATPEEIDKIFKEVLKTPKGPFEQMDVVGLDVVLDIEEHYAENRGNIPEKPREYLRKLIGEGKLGYKNGKGFYEYDK